MKFSAAIRKGCEKTHKIIELFDDNGGACAIGAAYLAIDPAVPLLETPLDRLKALAMLLTNFPCLHEKYLVKNGTIFIESLFNEVAQINNHTEESRESIADWLETLGY